jgi:hypothetical protein
VLTRLGCKLSQKGRDDHFDKQVCEYPDGGRQHGNSIDLSVFVAAFFLLVVKNKLTALDTSQFL